MIRKILAVILMTCSIALMCAAVWIYFHPEKDNNQGGKMKTEEKSEINGKEKDIYKSISGKAFEADDNGLKSVLIFAEYDESKEHQSMTILILGKNKNDSKVCKYKIDDNGESFVYNPDLQYPKKVEFKIKDKMLIIDSLKYKKGNINKYSN